MSLNPLNNPKDLVPSQKNLREVKADKATKLQGDHNGNFTLYIAYTSKAKQDQKTWRYCQTEGRKMPVNGFPYYSKAIGKPEPTPTEVLERFIKIIRQWAGLNDMMSHAIIYWNVNRGGRVNLYHKEKNIEYTFAENKQLMFFDSRGNTSNSAYKMLNAPILHPEEVSLEKLNAYYNRLRHDKVGEEQAKSVFRYFEYYFGSWEISKSPLVAEVSTDTPEELKPNVQPQQASEPAQDIQQASQEPNESRQEPQGYVKFPTLPALSNQQPAQQASQDFYANTSKYEPKQRQRAFKPLTQEEREAVNKDRENIKKENFLRELVYSSANIKEKVEWYEYTLKEKITAPELEKKLNSYKNG